MYVGRIVAIARTPDGRAAALYRVSSRSCVPPEKPGDSKMPLKEAPFTPDPFYAPRGIHRRRNAK